MKKTYILDDNERKLYQLSKISFTLLYAPLFGYTLNKDMFYIWLIIVLFGGVSLALKSKWIKPEMRTKVILSEIIITCALVFWIFSDSIPVPILIKQLVFIIVIFIFGYMYMKLLFNGKLTVK